MSVRMKSKAAVTVKKAAKPSASKTPRSAAPRPRKQAATKSDGKKAASKGLVPAPEVIAVEEEEDDPLKGFGSSSEDDDAGDSSDDEAAGAAALAELPKPNAVKAKGKEAGQRRQDNKAGKESKSRRGVIYLGHLPSAFPEAALRSYLSQFGAVLRLRLSRSRRTGRSKGYAFVEFKDRVVAEIVAETMDNYLLAGRLLKCAVLDDEKVHRRMWEGAGKTFRKKFKPRLAREKHNAEKTPEQQQAIKSRLLEREDAKREKLVSLGIKYDFVGYRGSA